MSQIKVTIRGIMFEVAKLLDLLSNGAIKPNHVTMLSLAGHGIIALAVIEGSFTESALMLVFFGLLDTLDGELARYQNSASQRGMLFDAVSDRLKEVLLYASLIFWFAKVDDDITALYAGLALGLSFVVSYIKAKGEVALLSSQNGPSENINRTFSIGIFGYEVRMFVLVVALASSELRVGLALIIAGSLVTFLERWVVIVKELELSQDSNDKN